MAFSHNLKGDRHAEHVFSSVLFPQYKYESSGTGDWGNRKAWLEQQQLIGVTASREAAGAQWLQSREERHLGQL